MGLEPILGVAKTSISLIDHILLRIWRDRLERLITKAPYPVYLFNRKHVITRCNRATDNLVGKSILGSDHKAVDRIFFERVHSAYREHWVCLQDYYGWQMGKKTAPPALHHPTFIDNRKHGGSSDNGYAGKLWEAHIYLTNLERSGLLCIVALTEATVAKQRRLDSGQLLPEHSNKADWITDSDYWDAVMKPPPRSGT